MAPPTKEILLKGKAQFISSPFKLKILFTFFTKQAGGQLHWAFPLSQYSLTQLKQWLYEGLKTLCESQLLGL